MYIDNAEYYVEHFDRLSTTPRGGHSRIYNRKIISRLSAAQFIDNYKS